MTKRLKEKINEQCQVYEAAKQGDTGSVCYHEFQNGEWGTDDANYTNRLRLSYYLLYNQIDDEELIAWLFQEELKDRESNSFQGIGSTLAVLTKLLQNYNTDGQYSEYFTRAKNANFDCLCGYDVDCVTVDEVFEHNSLLDCIYLAEELYYKDVMGDLVDQWKASITDWSENDISLLIDFNKFLERAEENEDLYQKQLAEALAAYHSDPDKQFLSLISCYKKLIRHYLDTGYYEKAYFYCNHILEDLDYRSIQSRRLFGDILEACAEVIANLPAISSDLWNRTKAEYQKAPRPGWLYGNLYKKGIQAAKAMKDPYAEELEQEYSQWLKKMSL